GYHEIVLTGVHLGCYGTDLAPPSSLAELFARIDALNPSTRVRLSSIEPHELTDEIIKRVAGSARFCRHFHIPLQSGDDRILQKMRRPYSGTFFRELVLRIHARIPDAAIGVDTLIGFPGETETAFENTYALIKELPVAYLHVFPYSARAGTPAAEYAHQAPPPVIKARCQRMRRLGKAKRIQFYQNFLGKELEVLIEGKKDGTTGLSKGISSNYIPVLIKAEDDLTNRLIVARVETLINESTLLGRFCRKVKPGETGTPEPIVEAAKTARPPAKRPDGKGSDEC
ncbi:MAG: radical SAM protein, partial [Desulfobacterales bacterium]